ncbi:hypothetical protein ZIOFF_056908 [Zingiber officinale]|uniref:Uncharacterized protein n=1 Tax=Zingiber officinale TaxID=94328 RepID=A0A8J5KQN5_ZINOF|nr:hypothetical protein ZIOFF_056908 [Zingiber officinale]
MDRIRIHPKRVLKLSIELPSGCIAFAAEAFSSPAFALIVFPSSVFSTVSSTLTAPSSVIDPSSNPTPIPHTAATVLPFSLWSPKNGRQTIGTPATAASSTEFHPQWVTKTPTAGCRSTSCCGAHPTTRPLSLVWSKNPRGSSSLARSLSDQRNAAPLASSPCARFANSSGDGVKN